MIPVTAHRYGEDALDLLIDLSRMPAKGDDRLATYLETQVHEEQAAAADTKDPVAFAQAKARSAAAQYYRALICAALRDADTDQSTREAAA